MDDLIKLLDSGVEKTSLCVLLDMTIHTLEDRIKKDNFTDSELHLLKTLVKK